MERGPLDAIAILGLPLAGKSEVARALARDYRLRHFSVREHFEREIRARSNLRPERLRGRGRWLPDELVLEAAAELVHDGSAPLVFDGFPGNRRQAELLDGVLAAAGLRLTAAAWLALPGKIAATRAEARRVCVRCDGGVHQAELDPSDPTRCGVCGAVVERRPDDRPAAFAARVRTYEAHAADLLPYLASRLVRVDATGPVPDVASAVARLTDLLANSPSQRAAIHDVTYPASTVRRREMPLSYQRIGNDGTSARR